MNNLGCVQKKLPCLFQVQVLDAPSDKRHSQPYKVIATPDFEEEAFKHDIHSARLSEKLDGTCVYVAKFLGKPWLWARLDRRPNKATERRLKKFLADHRTLQRHGEKSETEAEFQWDLPKDLKEVPATWIPALAVPVVDDIPQPDTCGHIPGWVPVDRTSRQHCWHLGAVDLDNSLGLVMREDDCYHGDLIIEARPLEELEGHTAELIGTHINGNPYGIGNKQCPIHLLVIHGIMGIMNAPRSKPPCY
ncbi:hypothetical protein ScPMuIL_016274 [Solemya velum]